MNINTVSLITAWQPDLIVSGGQSGADYGGLLGARDADIPTGGIAPAGFKTEYGPRPELGYLFGLVESESESYDVRTIDNIKMVCAVILITGVATSPGSRLTERMAHKYSKPLFPVDVPRLPTLEKYLLVEDIRSWLTQIRPSVLMIAGNRESVCPGIEQWTRQLLTKVFA